LLIRLPSTRHLVYRRPTIQWNPDRQRDQFAYMGSLGGTWVWQRAWPGKLAENITQAVARDVMAEAMLALEPHGVPMVGTIHDELIAEPRTRDADNVYTLMKTEMARTPYWAPGLVVAAEGFVAQRYQKK
jgi:DNA polymerase